MNRKSVHWRAGLPRRVETDTPCRSTRRRRTILLLGALLAGGPYTALSQPARKSYRIGYLSSGGPGSEVVTRSLSAFRDAMRKLGYMEGRDFVLEWRYADGRYERFPALARELVQLPVEVIVVIGGLPAIRAAQEATRTIPLVMNTITDPVGNGVVKSLAHPGGNVTGLASVHEQLGRKQFELLVTAAPKLASVAVLVNPENTGNAAILNAIEGEARGTRIKVSAVEVRKVSDIDEAILRSAQQRVEALIIVPDALFHGENARIAASALRNRIASIGPFTDYATAGGLMAYGNAEDDSVRVAAYVDKILKGTKPADLPIEQPARFDLVINMKTAKALGIAIPQSVLLQATKVIE